MRGMQMYCTHSHSPQKFMGFLPDIRLIFRRAQSFLGGQHN